IVFVKGSAEIIPCKGLHSGGDDIPMAGSVGGGNLTAPGVVGGGIGIFQKDGFVVEEIERVGVSLSAGQSGQRIAACGGQGLGVIAGGKGIVGRHVVIGSVKGKVKGIVLYAVKREN